MGQLGKLASVAGAVAVALLCARPVSADIIKCNSGIEKNGLKLQSAIVKALQKCKNAAVKSGTTATVAAACQSSLFKVADATNPASTMTKAKIALEALVTKLVCTDDDLRALGHLTEAIFGDRWSSWVIMSALKAAYEEQLWLVGDNVNVLISLGQLSGNPCPLCKTLGRAPCAKVPCSIGAGSQAIVLTGATNATITLPLQGVAIFEGCQYPGLFDITGTIKEIAVVGNPALGIKPQVLLGQDVCNLGVRTEGVTACGTAAGTTKPVSYVSCQDHNIEAGVDECDAFLGAGAVCQADSAPEDGTAEHPHTGVINGGACARFDVAASPALGASFAINTSQLTLSAGQRGPDGVPCTLDDTAPPGMPAGIPITTESAQVRMYDVQNTNGNTKNSATVTGTRASNCANLIQGNLGGVSFVGAFPAVDVPPTGVIGDTQTTLKIICSP